MVSAPVAAFEAHGNQHLIGAQQAKALAENVFVTRPRIQRQHV